MAYKRMFSKGVIDTDKFYDLPFNAQLLYFHLGLNADVKGFIEPKRICRLVGLKVEDLKPLIQEGFVIPFDSGVVVITHWKLNNSVRDDREAPTTFINECKKLVEVEGVYTTPGVLLEEDGSTPAQYRIGKDSIEEKRIEKSRLENTCEQSSPNLEKTEIEEIASNVLGSNKKSGINYGWQDTAFRFADKLNIELDDKLKPRWLKVFKDADGNADLSKRLSIALGSVVDAPNFVALKSAESKIKYYLSVAYKG